MVWKMAAVGRLVQRSRSEKDRRLEKSEKIDGVVSFFEDTLRNSTFTAKKHSTVVRSLKVKPV